VGYKAFCKKKNKHKENSMIEPLISLQLAS
jgi:hypothetical protein